ncbi:MAG TPA: DUF4132 domain-containing protein [Roseiflexaceae bacterium]|nr:DUF4132 domain-containing protein [Roseiflexaceae bacterium]
MANPSDAAVLPHLTPWLINTLIGRLRQSEDPAAGEALRAIRAWRNPQASRWEPGEGCAGVIGADAVLRALSEITTQQIPPQPRTAALLELYAAARGTSRDLLEDALAQECGLGGQLVIDYGVRRFVLELGQGHTPLLRLPGGRAYTACPRPRAGELFCLLKAAWKILRRRLLDESRTQTMRLERAMLAGRRWSVPEFEQLVLRNALLAELARRQIWAGYGPDGTLLECWSLADQLSPVNEDYAPVRLERFAAIGLPHPAQVAPARRLAWVALLSDFLVVEQFPQAGRPVYELTEAERQGEGIERFAAVALRGGTMAGELPRRGWLFISSRCGLRPFPAHGVTAVLALRYAAQEEWVTRLFFARGLLESGTKPDDIAALPLAQIDPVAVSEVILDIAWLASWASSPG